MDEGFSLAGGGGSTRTCNSFYCTGISSHSSSFPAGASEQSSRDVLGHGPWQGQELGCLGVPFYGWKADLSDPRWASSGHSAATLNTPKTPLIAGNPTLPVGVLFTSCSLCSLCPHTTLGSLRNWSLRLDLSQSLTCGGLIHDIPVSLSSLQLGQAASILLLPACPRR